MKKLQTSIEFLLILSAISIVCLGMIAVYANNVSFQKEAVSALASHGQNSSYQIQSNQMDYPEISTYIPLNSTVGDQGSAQLMAYGCSSGNITADFNSASLALENSSIHSDFSGVYMGRINFDPEMAGISVLNLTYRVDCGGASLGGNKTLVTYVSEKPETGDNASTPMAYISKRNESISYGLTPPSPVLSLNEWNRCTQLGFLGNPLNMQSQCGTSNGWEYEVFSSQCYTSGGSQTTTYCIIPSTTSDDTTSINPDNLTYIYGFQLQISGGYGSMFANIINSDLSSNVTLNGKVIGTAQVVSVYSPVPSESYAFIGEGEDYGVLNQTGYSAYQEARDNLYSVAGYYNQSSVSGDVQSAIQQVVAGYGSAATSLTTSATSNLSGCTFSMDRLICTAEYPFVYTINVSINDEEIGNSTIYYAGSVINLRQN